MEGNCVILTVYIEAGAEQGGVGGEGRQKGCAEAGRLSSSLRDLLTLELMRSVRYKLSLLSWVEAMISH